MPTKHTRECWVLLADGVPIGVFTNHRSAVVERLRFSREQAEDTSGRPKLSFTLSAAVQLMED